MIRFLMFKMQSMVFKCRQIKIKIFKCDLLAMAAGLVRRLLFTV